MSPSIGRAVGGEMRCVVLVVGLFFATSQVSAGSLQKLVHKERELMRKAERNPSDPAVSRAMATLRADIAIEKANVGQFEDAVAYMQNSLALAPKHAERWEKLGDFAAFVGNPIYRQLRIRAYDKALRYDRRRASAKEKLAALLLSANRHQEALELLEDLSLGTETGKVTTQYLDLLVTLYVTQNRLARGKSTLRRMASKAPKAAKIGLTLAILYKASNMPEKAKRTLDTWIPRMAAGSAERRYAETLRRKYEGSGATQPRYLSPTPKGPRIRYFQGAKPMGKRNRRGRAMYRGSNVKGRPANSSCSAYNASPRQAFTFYVVRKLGPIGPCGLVAYEIEVN